MRGVSNRMLALSRKSLPFSGFALAVGRGGAVSIKGYMIDHRRTPRGYPSRLPPAMRERGPDGSIYAYSPATIGMRAARIAGNSPPTKPTTSASATPSAISHPESLKSNTTWVKFPPSVEAVTPSKIR